MLPTRPGHRGQGLQLPRFPRLPAATRHRAHHSREGRPAATPAAAREPRRSTARIRPGNLPPAQPRRALLQPAQGLPRHRDQIRQDRHLIRGSGQSRVAPALGKIRLKTDPSSDVPADVYSDPVFSPQLKFASSPPPFHLKWTEVGHRCSHCGTSKTTDRSEPCRIHVSPDSSRSSFSGRDRTQAGVCRGSREPNGLRLVTILLAYSVPGGAGGSLVGTAAAVLAIPVAGGVWNVDAAEAVADRA